MSPAWQADSLLSRLGSPLIMIYVLKNHMGIKKFPKNFTIHISRFGAQLRQEWQLLVWSYERKSIILALASKIMLYQTPDFLNIISVLCCSLSLSYVQIFAAPWTAACLAPLSMGILQARILELVAMPSSRGSSRPRDWTQISCITGSFFTSWAIFY